MQPRSTPPPHPSGRLTPAGARLGDYQVLGELGRGGMGVVLRARDPRTGRDVALKTLLRPQPEALARFRREAQALAALDHPGIVKVHGTGEADGRPFMVCELVEGARALDRAAAPLSLEARVALVRDACRALGHAHARGVVHRDVKAENLLVDADGRVRVTDFGLAVLESAERLTRTGAVVGTPFTMAPEQMAGARDAVGPATDVWALGVVLYQALTGELPFTGESLPELCARICEAAPVPPRRHAPAVSASLEAVCLRALSRDPADRWSHGDAMADALDAALRGERVAGRRRSLRPLLWVAAPGASLALLAAALLYDPGAPASPTALAPDVATTATPRRGPERVAPRDDVPAPVTPRPAEQPPDEPDTPLVQMLRAEAERGGTGAMLQLGRLYQNGDGGVRVDLTRAREWFGRAARAGDTWGMVNYAKMLVDGRGGPRSLLEGVELLRVAAEEQQHPEAAAAYARLYEKGLLGLDRTKNLDQTVRWLRKAVEREDDLRTKGGYRSELADALLDRARPDDLSEAMNLYERAIDDGSQQARLRLAQHLLDGTFGMASPSQARRQLERLREDDPGREPEKVAELLRRCDELEAGQ